MWSVEWSSRSSTVRQGREGGTRAASLRRRRERVDWGVLATKMAALYRAAGQSSDGNRGERRADCRRVACDAIALDPQGHTGHTNKQKGTRTPSASAARIGPAAPHAQSSSVLLYATCALLRCAVAQISKPVVLSHADTRPLAVLPCLCPRLATPLPSAPSAPSHACPAAECDRLATASSFRCGRWTGSATRQHGQRRALTGARSRSAACRRRVHRGPPLRDERGKQHSAADGVDSEHLPTRVRTAVRHELATSSS